MALPTQKTNREKRKFLSVFLLQKRRKKRTKCTKQLPLKKTLFFILLISCFLPIFLSVKSGDFFEAD